MIHLTSDSQTFSKEISIMIFLLLSTVIGYGLCNQSPLVETPLGPVLGYVKTSFSGSKFFAFEGIPYAKPPIGEKRFEEAEPVEPWEDVYNATVITQCAQTEQVNQSAIFGVEDCLQMFVYVPRDVINPDENLHVLVHIHAGAFLYGSATQYAWPQFLMDRDLIFVTFNYRLGIFGFLSTEDDVVPGNNGLKDQVLALKWVQNNIASFGGNPNSITLTGGSAGSISVHMHYFSKLSRGLFHRGWSESGLATVPDGIIEGNLEKAQKLGNALDCPTESTRVMIDCLKELSHEEILAKQSVLFGYKFLPLITFGPVIEKDGPNPFLTEHPYQLLSKGDVYDVPFLISTDLHEAIIFVEAFDDLDYLNENWDELAPFSLDFNYTLDRSLWKNASETIKQYYFSDIQLTNNNEAYMTLMQLYNDRQGFVDVGRTLREQANVMESPIYYYMFAYLGENNPQKIVPHGAEVKYIFGAGATNFTANDLAMRDLLLDMIVSYASTGVPKFEGVEWKPAKPDEIVYVNITGIEPGEIIPMSITQLAPEDFWKGLHLDGNEI